MSESEGTNKRVYARSTHFNLIVRVSKDKFIWKKANATELSSSGLELRTPAEHEVGTVLWLDLTVQGFLSEFSFKAEATIRRNKGLVGGEHIYGMSFNKLPEDLRIRIDENVKNDRPAGGDAYSAD
ncbi:MAG: hypothetical protein Ta2A_21210 [Treponemataceae bacterium]|nr:MAG: hypothetical protein Ta2A_21210 [Treponemataceae bacterium]